MRDANDDLALPPIPAFLKRQPTGASMTTPTPEPTKKRTVRPDAIVATISMHALGSAKDDDYIDKAMEMRKRIDLAIAAIKDGAPDWLVVTADKPKQGRVPG